MRLGLKTQDAFIEKLNQQNSKLQEIFLKKIDQLTKPISIKVMLGDNTISEQKTFDPKAVTDYYNKILQQLSSWKIQEVTTTQNDDIRRIFSKFEIREGNYILSGHMSIQFHVLLFYKPDNKVLEYKKELTNILDTTKDQETKLADQSDQFILEKLQNMGYTDLDHQKLFEVFFENDKVEKQIYEDIEKNTETNFKKLANRKKELINELDNLLLETYQTTSILIDEARLVTGEEGCLCIFDLEFIKNNTKEGLFDSKKIPSQVKERLIERLEEIKNIL